jgi:hypothetical protein
LGRGVAASRPAGGAAARARWIPACGRWPLVMAGWLRLRPGSSRLMRFLALGLLVSTSSAVARRRAPLKPDEGPRGVYCGNASYLILFAKITMAFKEPSSVDVMAKVDGLQLVNCPAEPYKYSRTSDNLTLTNLGNKSDCVAKFVTLLGGDPAGVSVVYNTSRDTFTASFEGEGCVFTHTACAPDNEWQALRPSSAATLKSDDESHDAAALLMGAAGAEQTTTRLAACTLPLHRVANSSSDCCALCMAEPACKAFFWRPPTVCWIKTAAVGGIPCDGCIVGAAVVLPPSPSPPSPPPAQPGCSSMADCNGARCENDRCICDRGWEGQHCELIKFGSAFACGRGGLCLNHSAGSAATGGAPYADNFTSSWGGEAVQDDQGNFHMYAASFGQDKALGSWLTNSRVVHAVSKTPFGPYTLADVALGPRPGAWDGLTQHNPAIQRDPLSGTYLLYYMGSTDNGTVTSGGGACKNEPQTKPVCNQRVGLATATHPGGPWTRRAQPIIAPGPLGAWDDQFTTNPVSCTQITLNTAAAPPRPSSNLGEREHCSCRSKTACCCSDSNSAGKWQRPAAVQGPLEGRLWQNVHWRRLLSPFRGPMHQDWRGD